MSTESNDQPSQRGSNDDQNQPRKDGCENELQTKAKQGGNRGDQSRQSTDNNPIGNDQENSVQGMNRFKTIVLPALGALVGIGGFWVARIGLLDSRTNNAAYIDVEGQVIGLGRRRTVDVKLTFKNTGNTPAQEFEIDVNVFYDAYPRESLTGAVYIDRNTPTSVAAGGECYFVDQVFHVDVNAMKRRKAAIYAIGRISYKDAYGRERVQRVSLIQGGRYKYNNDIMGVYRCSQ